MPGRRRWEASSLKRVSPRASNSTPPCSSSSMAKKALASVYMTTKRNSSGKRRGHSNDWRTSSLSVLSSPSSPSTSSPAMARARFLHASNACLKSSSRVGKYRKMVPLAMPDSSQMRAIDTSRPTSQYMRMATRMIVSRLCSKYPSDTLKTNRSIPTTIPLRHRMQYVIERPTALCHVHTICSRNPIWPRPVRASGASLAQGRPLIGLTTKNLAPGPCPSR